MHQALRNSSTVIAQSIAWGVAAQIKSGSSLISAGANTQRLIFQTASRRTDLNIAIATDQNRIWSFMKNRRWTALKVTTGDQENTVYVNINSLAKRLGIGKPEIFQAIQNRSLEALVSNTLREKIKKIEAEEGIVAPAAKVSPVKIESLFERIRAALVDIWWAFSTGSWNLFRLRFLLNASDENLQKQGQLRALGAYRNALSKVPGYKGHIKNNVRQANGQPILPVNFDDIPPMDKKNYIQKDANVERLYLYGQIPKVGQLDSSTGTTGEPALWMRSKEEMATAYKLLGFAEKAKFGSSSPILINTFALGLWATGVTLAGAGPQHGLIANVGIVPDYVEKTVNIIKHLGKNSETPIVLCGYPPNIRKIAEAIQNDQSVKNKNLDLQAIVGGEGMTEELRQDILSKGFSKVFSSYGASDLDINIGHETDTQIAIRQACIDNPSLAKELYGGGPPPMIFCYDPLHYFIETNQDGELLYTCCLKERASPRIRYNLHDTGKVMMAKDVKALLQKYGIEISLQTNLPFLFVHGREGTVSYGGSKIHYEHLEQGIRAIDLQGQIGRDRFALHKPQENTLEFWIEASSEEAYENIRNNINSLQKTLINTIAQENTDFKKILDGGANPYPQIKLFKKESSPMAIHAKQNPHRKLQRVVLNNPEVQQQLQELSHSFVMSTGRY